jgi:hypothetical protein
VERKIKKFKESTVEFYYGRGKHHPANLGKICRSFSNPMLANSSDLGLGIYWDTHYIGYRT